MHDDVHAWSAGVIVDAAKIRMILLAAVVPACTACALAWALWRHTPARQSAIWGMPFNQLREPCQVALWRRLALLALFAAAGVYSYRAVFGSGLPKWPFMKASQALVLAPLLGAAFGLALEVLNSARIGRAGAARGVLIALASCSGVVIALMTLLRAEGGRERWGVVALASATIAIVFGTGLHALWSRRGLAASVAGCVIIIALSPALVLGYASLSLGLLAGCAGATVLGASLIGLWRPAWCMASGAGLVVTVLCIALLTQGIALGDGHERWKWVYAGLLAIAPWCAAWMASVGSRSDLRRGAVVLLAAALPCAIALALCAWQYFATPKGW